MSLPVCWITLPTAPVTLPVNFWPGKLAPNPSASVYFSATASVVSFDSKTALTAYTSGTPNVIISSS